jgi:hypothetical protein
LRSVPPHISTAPMASGSGGRDSSRGGRGRGGYSESSMDAGIARAEKVGWKRKSSLCKFFEKGCCQRKSGCTFAHGAEELQRELSRAEYYKRHSQVEKRNGHRFE